MNWPCPRSAPPPPRVAHLKRMKLPARPPPVRDQIASYALTPPGQVARTLIRPWEQGRSTFHSLNSQGIATPEVLYRPQGAIEVLELKRATGKALKEDRFKDAR